ncbi:MAG: hypothetical protein SGI72_15150 [Planctomycetota bacterium]|nr:hypothetical protein [Planctomycetota bacterium]
MPIESQNAVLVWIASLTAVCAASAAVAAWLLVARAKHIEDRLERLERLDELAAEVKKLTRPDQDLDVRRVEHVLIDIRDAHKRVEERLLSMLESQSRESLAENAGRSLTLDAANGLQDRIVTRLLALGYERIVLVTEPADMARIANEGGAIVVEARRDGAACKGRAIIEGGRIQDIQIQSAYSTFP